jgi:predicted dehydrogenase
VTNEKPLRLGVIGVGRMGSHHARLYSETEGVELVGVVDTDPARRDEARQKWQVETFDSVDSLLERGVDAVSIATPTVTHRAVGEPLLGARVACLIEKPLAASEDEARALAEVGERSGAVLQVGHIVRYDPVTLAVRAIENFNPRFIQVDRVSPMTFRSVDIGVVLDMMIHDIDVLLMLLGNEPVEVHASAVAVLGDTEDVCNARLTFPPGDDGIPCVANVTASRLALKTERKMRLISEDAYVSADFVARQGTVVRKQVNAEKLEEVRKRLAAGEDLSHVDYLEHVKVEPLDVRAGDPLRLQIDDFLAAVRSHRRASVDVQAGFAAVRTARRIVAAAKAAGAKRV